MNDDLKEKITNLPSSPGVYLMKDAGSRILYVGKAKDLKKRVVSYFNKGAHQSLKTGILVEKIADFDTIITNTEKEALILESNLIKRHRPRYNVILKDDKRYPCLRLDIGSPYPNLTVSRKMRKDGAVYFGPFASPGAVRETLKLIHRTFKLRKCKGKRPDKRDRPCLNYQMELCLGPCSLAVDPKVYGGIVKEVSLFLKGRTPELVRQVRRDMEEAAGRQDFEAAAGYRDRLFALQTTLEKQVATTADLKDRDVVGIARQADAVLIMVLFIRGGFLLGNRAFYFPKTEAPDTEVLSAFVKQYYSDAPFVPKEVLLPTAPEDRLVLEEWLGDLKGEKVHVIAPHRGEKVKMVALAGQNAEKSLQERLNAAMAEEEMLENLRRRLTLARRPDRIECFDLSNIAGSQGVGAMVVFEKGRALRQSYRKYRIKTAHAGDDYGMLREVLTRRYGKRDHEEPLPDLLMVDGGKGQLNMAVAVLRTLDLYGSFDVIGIAKKEPERGETEDKIYKPGRKNPLNLHRAPEVLLFLQRVRDEAHRFVIRYHRKRRIISYRRSVLEEIPEIGPKRRETLLKHFGSVKRIKDASFEEILAVPGMTEQAVKNLLDALRLRPRPLDDA